MAYTFNAPDAPERHDLQYFEMFGNRGIYFKGWTAVTKHRTPWKMAVGAKQKPFDEDVWELYDASDYSQAHDLAKQNPEKLAYLQRLWLIEATKYNVIPLDDRFLQRGIPQVAGRPTICQGDKQLYFPGEHRITEASVLNIKNKSFTVTAQLVMPDGDGRAHGTILAQGQKFGGWGLQMHEGKARFVYNLLGVKQFVIDADKAAPSGEHQVRAEFAYDGGGWGKGGNVTLYYDGQKAGQGKVDATEAIIFSATEGLDIGMKWGTPVMPGADGASTVFNGQIKWVELSVGKDHHSHLIDPDDIVHMLMARQ